MKGPGRRDPKHPVEAAGCSRSCGPAGQALSAASKAPAPHSDDSSPKSRGRERVSLAGRLTRGTWEPGRARDMQQMTRVPRAAEYGLGASPKINLPWRPQRKIPESRGGGRGTRPHCGLQGAIMCPKPAPRGEGMSAMDYRPAGHWGPQARRVACSDPGPRSSRSRAGHKPAKAGR